MSDIKVWNFNETLTYYLVSFEQQGPDELRLNYDCLHFYDNICLTGISKPISMKNQLQEYIWYWIFFFFFSILLGS